jgi:predicted RNA binding protein YcfA (HicA-like mRNA interferase family)
LPRLPVLAGNEIVQALQRAGFVLDRQSGSHKILKDRNRDLTVSVPVHANKPVKRGTLRAIIRDAGLTRDEFLRFTK